MGELEVSLNPILNDLRRRLTLLEGNFTPMLDDLKMRIGALETNPVTSVTGVKSAVKAKLYVELTAALVPLRLFFRKFSTQIQTPGDKLDQQIASLTSGLARVEPWFSSMESLKDWGEALWGQGYSGLLPVLREDSEAVDSWEPRPVSEVQGRAKVQRGRSSLLRQ
jgi:hypothetical protein